MPDISLEAFVRQLFAEHPAHSGHTQTVEVPAGGGIILVCSCGVRLVAPK